MTSFKWNHFLEYARSYDKDNLEEFKYRSALSRAYYYTYHIAEEYIKKNGIKKSEDEGGSHEKLWNTFIHNNKNDISLRGVGADGTNLRIKRTIADYNESKKITRRDLKEAIRIADKTTRNLNIQNKIPESK